MLEPEAGGPKPTVSRLLQFGGIAGGAKHRSNPVFLSEFLADGASRGRAGVDCAG